MTLLKTEEELQAFLADTMNKECVTPLDQHQETWKQYFTALGEFVRFCNKTADDLKNYQERQANNRVKQAEKQVQEKEATLVRAARAAAKAAAAQVKSAEKQPSATIFSLVKESFSAVAEARGPQQL